MIGVFDSGHGGVNTVKELRRLFKYEDIVLFCDRKNSPFGTKSGKQIRDITENGINLLLKKGVRSVLIGCCTASTVYPYLTKKVRNIAFPIITPTVEAALNKSRKISVIATDLTVRTGTFKKEILRLSPTAKVYEISAQSLVYSAERGEADGNISKATAEHMESIVYKIKKSGSEALILGCTHFPSFYGELASRLEGISVISSTGAAVTSFAAGNPEIKEKGRLIYISS